MFDSTTGVVTSDATAGHFNLFQPGGGFMCICPEGMQWNEWKRACEDINECIEMDDPCYRQNFQYLSLILIGKSVFRAEQIRAEIKNFKKRYGYRMY